MGKFAVNGTVSPDLETLIPIVVLFTLMLDLRTQLAAAGTSVSNEAFYSCFIEYLPTVTRPFHYDL